MLYILLILSVIVAFLTPAVQVSRITVDDDGLIALRDVSITLEYVHSVEFMDIAETYSVSSCRIMLVNFTWPGVGAGLPTLGDYPNHIRSVGKIYSLENITLPSTLVISMRYRLSPKLLINGMEVPVKNAVVIDTCSHASLAEIILCWMRGCLIAGEASTALINPYR